MNPAITRIIAEVIRAEGGYSNNPHDRGGETMYGITVAVARANDYQGDMREMPRSVAESIYLKRYVTEPRFDQVVAVNASIGLEVIDTGVNMGPSRAAEYLQRWLNGFNLPDSGYQDLFVDGRLGLLSIDALKRFLAKRGREGESVLLRGLNSTQGNRYLELTEANRTQRTFLYGWVKERVQVPA
ncbi:glycoside hydrolase family 108 protein [Pseudomonas sp. UBA6323]|uniref:glycoside hydrolase family 108 protein n=1 Tax=Pseudomonas sp. UBA6323 TaxID=1947329 RepID=UPI0025E777DA|nr:glycosyl hydrolase 108 family protein [Pseudomonas sp. UBA6323]